MNKGHAAHGIPVATASGEDMVRSAILNARVRRGVTEPDLVDPEKISITLVGKDSIDTLWNSVKMAVVTTIAIAAGVNNQSDAWPIPSSDDVYEGEELKMKIQQLSSLIAVPATHRQVREFFSSFKETLASKEGRDLGFKIRQNARQMGDATVTDSDRDTKRYEMRNYFEELLSLCFERYRESQLNNGNEDEERIDALERALVAETL